MLLDPVIGGIAMGCIYSLIVLGFNMLIRAMNLLHFAALLEGRTILGSHVIKDAGATCCECP